jgi:hypothetical protein
MRIHGGGLSSHRSTTGSTNPPIRGATTGVIMLRPSDMVLTEVVSLNTGVVV